MGFYHYTSLSAFSSILQNTPVKDKEICFWATRYDCFVDETEYVHGIDKLRPVLEKFEEHSGLQQDKKISPLFRPTDIISALGLPVPYVISMCDRRDNIYLWKNYAENCDGVALELEFKSLRGCYEVALCSIESCIYDSRISNEDLFKLVEDKFFDGAGQMLSGWFKDYAIKLLKENPESFVKIIAIYLLAFVAPRFKKDDFLNEEETRIIIFSPKSEYNNLFDGVLCPDQLKPIIDAVQRFVAEEKQRSDNGNFYREIFMPISVLKRVYVKKQTQKEKVEKILSEKGYAHIPVELMNER